MAEAVGKRRTSETSLTDSAVTPIVSIDHYRIGNGEVGPITRSIANAYHDIVRAIDPRYEELRTAV